MRHVIAITLALLLAACSEQPSEIQMPPPAVGVHVVSDQEFEASREFIGRTSAPARVEVRARVSGILESRNFEEGAAVIEGQPLFEIERATYAARVDQATAQVESTRAQLNEAEVRLNRIEQLGKNRSVSEQDVDEARAAMLMARAGLKGAEASLEQAELDLERTAIHAPIDGRIGESMVDTGNLVGPESGPLATVVGLDPIHVHFSLSDVEYLEFRRQRAERAMESEDASGLTPRLRLSDDSDYPHSGRLELVGNEIDPGTGTLTVRAVFPNPDELLRPGQFVTVIIERTLREKVLMIPQAAVLTSSTGHSVMVVGDDSIAEQRTIETGERSGDMWVVKSGLESGERVIVRGLQRVSPGITVNVVEN